MKMRNLEAKRPANTLGKKAQRGKDTKNFLFCAYAPICLCALLLCFSSARAETWRLDDNKDFKLVAAQNQDGFLKAVADAKMLVNTGKTKQAKKAFTKLKSDFPEIAGPDLDLFIKAELLLSQKKLTKSAKNYDKLLTNFPKSGLREAAIERQFNIGKTFLSGRKKIVLGFIPISGRAEGIAIMEKVTDHAGMSSQIGTQAAIEVAEIYEKQENFSEAYLKWWEVSSQWSSGVIGRDALLGMAKNKHAMYNKNPENKRPFYDASCLLSARSYYEKFKLMFPQDAEKLAVDQTLKDIYEQLAYKDLVIGLYYRRTGNQVAANLYLDLVISDWPESQAAQTAKKARSKNSDS